MQAPPTANASNPRYKPLLGFLLLAFSAYSSLFYVEEVLSHRDYSVISQPELRVGYCIATSISILEKHALAETVARPPDDDMFSAVISQALLGEVTEQKQAALRALKERDELRRRAVKVVLDVAEKCGYDRVTWSPGDAPFKIAEKWLQNDATFSFFLETAKKPGPDEAARFYDSLRRGI